MTRGSVSAFFGLTAEHLLAFESVAGGGAEKGAEGGAEGGTTRRVTYDVDPDADADAAARTMMASAHRWCVYFIMYARAIRRLTGKCFVCVFTGLSDGGGWRRWRR